MAFYFALHSHKHLGLYTKTQSHTHADSCTQTYIHTQSVTCHHHQQCGVQTRVLPKDTCWTHVWWKAGTQPHLFTLMFSVVRVHATLLRPNCPKCHAVTTKMNTDQSKKEKLYHSFRFLDSFTSSLHHVLLQLSGSALTWQRTGPRPSLDPPLMPQPWTCVNFGMGFHLNSLLSLPLSCAELEPPREETFDRKRVRGCFFTFFCYSQ